MAAPFVNYWNGDRCEIEDDYRKCGCGRWYRPFKMLQNRPFALKGPTRLTEIREQIGRLDFKGKINQVQFDGLSVNVHLNEELDRDSIDKIKEILSDYAVSICK
jgi:phenylacetate-coenzyme A ligase PaaK-like adenylate-forming protein